MIKGVLLGLAIIGLSVLMTTLIAFAPVLAISIILAGIVLLFALIGKSEGW